MTQGPAPTELRGCYVLGCTKEAVARGLCPSCYHTAWKRGQLPARTKATPLVPRKTWMSVELDRSLRKLSRITGKTCSEIIREALTKHLGG